MKKITLSSILFVLCFSSILNGQALKPNYDWWQPNGEVKAIAGDSQTLYVGGTFTGVAPNIRYAAKFDTINEFPVLGFNNKINPNGSVYAVVNDGNGGWIIGGNFTKVGSSERTYLAKINQDGSLNTWTPVLDGLVKSLHVKNKILYVGGDFKAVNGQPRRALAAFNISNDSLVDLKVMINGGVSAVNSDNNSLYLGGSFDYAASTHNRFDISWDLANKNNPLINAVTPNGNVLCSYPDGNGGWYIGGEFTKVGNSARQYLARINADGTLNNWTPPAPNRPVTSLAVVDKIVYISGSFDLVGDSSRSGLAAIDDKGKNIYSGIQHLYMSDGKLHVENNYIYIFGYGGALRFNTKNPYEKWSASMTKVFGWKIDGTPYLFEPPRVKSIFTIDTFVLFSGDFNWVNGKNGSGPTAVFSSNSGLCLTSINIGTNSTVNAFAYDGTGIVVVGDFTSIGGLTRKTSAKINYPGFTISSWNLAFNGSPNNIINNGDYLYITGNFDTAQYVKRDGFVELDIKNNNNLTTWTPAISGRNINTISKSNNKIYLGGELLTGYRLKTKNFTVYNISTSLLENVELNINGEVKAIKPDGNDILLGGSFTKINDSLSTGFGSLDKTSKLPNTSNTELILWNGNGAVYSIETDADHIYLGGQFFVRYINNSGDLLEYLGLLPMDKAKKKIIIPEKQTGIGFIITDLKFYNKTLYAGGCTFVPDPNTGQYKQLFGVFKVNKESIDYYWKNLCNSWVRSFSLSGNTLFSGGDFTMVNEQKRNNAFAINAKTGQLTDWDPNVDGTVNTMIIAKDKIFLGGKFNNVGGQARSNLAAVNAKDAAPVAWRPNPDNEVLCLAKSNDTLYAGGYFKTISGSNRNYLASLDITTSYAFDWSPNPNYIVNCILPAGDKIYVGGAFQTIAGQNRNYIAKFRKDGTLLPWNAYAYKYKYREPFPYNQLDNSGGIRDMLLDGNNLYVGGDVNIFNYTNARQYILGTDVFDVRDGIAQIDANTGAATSWNAKLNYNAVVNSIAIKDSFVFAGGNLDMENEPKRPSLVSLYKQNASIGSLNIKPNNIIYKVYSHNNSILLGGAFNSLDNITFNYLASLSAPYPYISYFTPQAAAQGERVSIYGEYFTGASKVKFGNADAASFGVVNDNEIWAIVGSGASGAVTVQTPYGTASKSLFTYKTGLGSQAITEKDFEIYPNPATREITVKLKKIKKNSEYAVYSMLGNKVLSGHLNQLNNTLNISTLNNGIYLLKISDDNAITVKIIKE